MSQYYHSSGCGSAGLCLPFLPLLISLQILLGFLSHALCFTLRAFQMLSSVSANLPSITFFLGLSLDFISPAKYSLIYSLHLEALRSAAIESYVAQNNLESKLSSRSSPPFYVKQRTLSPKGKNGH